MDRTAGKAALETLGRLSRNMAKGLDRQDGEKEGVIERLKDAPLRREQLDVYETAPADEDLQAISDAAIDLFAAFGFTPE